MNHKEKSQYIAQTILQQLGGNKFIVMTGAKHIGALDAGLQFSMPSNFANNKANLVTIVVNDYDLYNIQFFKKRGAKIDSISRHENIFCDMLQRLFTSQTGLDTHL